MFMSLINFSSPVILGTNRSSPQRSATAVSAKKPSPKEPTNQESFITFILDEQLCPFMYEIDDDPLNQLTNFLANFNTFQLNEIMYAIDPRMTNAQYENLLVKAFLTYWARQHSLILFLPRMHQMQNYLRVKPACVKYLTSSSACASYVVMVIPMIQE
jgi:hypothetical protein